MQRIAKKIRACCNPAMQKCDHGSPLSQRIADATEGFPIQYFENSSYTFIYSFCDIMLSQSILVGALF